MLLELANLEGTLVRTQLLRHSSERERQRYINEKVKINAAADSIRTNTLQLKIQLEEARRTLALRKEYDDLAERIMSNPLLVKSRDTQQAQLNKLETEIAELEQESLDYKRTWAERREQFGRIVEEGRQMLLLIKDEKEEAERKEGMASATGSPRAPPEGGSTPVPDGIERLAPPRLKPLPQSRSESRAQSPSKAADEDVEMGEVSGTPVESANTVSEMEEGEAEDDESMVEN